MATPLWRKLYTTKSAGVLGVTWVEQLAEQKMNKLKIIPTLLLLINFTLIGCATSMTPSQLKDKLPALTKSEYLDKAVADEAIAQEFCRLLVSNRTYAAPVGFTVSGDLRNGAKGIDEWVEVDGGNAYALNNFNWATIDQWGSTQLTIHFDTLLCEKRKSPRIEI